ncbi:hypothetical protein D515_02154 [Grimontia indica]|uniref:O-antigen ligase-related domain-containing protein n=1 Tax=Grimontia indica TaxID=1056512 RepID=R1INP0_9GAMM|nr:O-antigen ligase family protein [Grimontia indica]EOD79082.1 hypothetical protein D515_02154 [Grimontia indica]
MIFALISFGVFFFSGALLFLFDTENPSNIFAAISALFYGVSGILLFARRVEAINYIIASRYPMLICLLAFLSIIWSHDQSLAINRSIALLGTMMFALTMVIYLDYENIIKAIVYPLFISALLAVFFALFVPSIGIDDGSNISSHYGLWQGTFGFKNRLGRVMGLLAVVILAQDIFSKRKTNMMLAITILVLLMSGSSTPILAVFFVSIAKAYITISHRISMHLKIAIGITSIYAMLLIPFILEIIVVDLMGKDFSGSGRVEMWTDILFSIDSPYLGYGFGGGFWGEFGYASGLIESRYILLGHAHNGFVDTLIELGVLGVIFYFMLLLKCLIDSLRNYRTQGEYFLLPLFLSVFFIIYSVTGSAYIKQNNILFILACLAAFLPYKKVK